ncbi:permease [Burkholderia thailandensis]|uniref:Permease n=1 Tax=Burkholderia thailandensis (strain ATCC 700388 / DSM 13276 / CCUG 48851 / CIP 106301 / E264) TaxID=271848 RepID=Q2SVR4_BURTA|nr:permease [Burkholderia thailandensis E264]AJT48749.1 permease [Burkholderia thailandensis]AVR10642.1 permease [Burkholderia thailandensis]AVR26439.1 permease [Burkholderia thailandensis]AWY59748.1 permease [Burkholderia thailandensis]
MLVHAVLWPLALNAFAGFQTVPATPWMRRPQ